MISSQTKPVALTHRAKPSSGQLVSTQKLPGRNSSFSAKKTRSCTQRLMKAVRRAVDRVDIQKGGTTPRCPLMTFDNVMVDMTSGTQNTIAGVCAAIGSAHQEILFQIYEWSDADESTRCVMAALQQRVNEAWARTKSAISIRIVLNRSLSSLWQVQHRDLQAFAAAIRMHPNSSGTVRFELAYYPGYLLNILHTKSLVIDNKLGMVLTGNLKTHESKMAADYYNMGICYAGPVVQTLRDDWLDARSASRLSVSVPNADVDRPWLTPEFKPYAMGGANLFGACVLTRQANWRYTSAGHNNPQAQGLLALIGATHTAIYAINPALSAPPIVDALIDAILLRQVEVNVVLSLNMDRSVQHRFGGGDNVDVAYRMLNTLLTEQGAAAARRLHVWFASDGRGAPAPSGSTFNIHAKAAAFDDTCLFAGSMNWDWQSWNNSRELSVASFSPSIVNIWQTHIYMPLREKSARLRGADLPDKCRRLSDPVFTFLQM